MSRPQISGHLPRGTVTVTRRLVPADPSVRSDQIISLQLRSTGELVLHDLKGGRSVMLFVADDCNTWENFYSVPADQVRRLGDDPASALEAAVAASTVDPASPMRESATIRAFVAWLDAHGVRYETGEIITYDD
ncbi:hypothetical protein [Cryptosporangium phraense]|uniref:Uncharacterized protein n=1 Tax=Cryptosporangium phraense TaxID=2593070 RepID=A0A545AHN0_9ACTN|nr:hypothetical protein [Cryptosporangium phraense]TQS40833.1 hypothetical protein FL583_32625 [Cryptosporangium phraense]